MGKKKKKKEWNTAAKYGCESTQINSLLGWMVHHLQWSPFLWIEYVEFGGIETIPDVKFHLTQVPTYCLAPKNISDLYLTTKVQFNIYPWKATETPYTYQLPHDHLLVGGEVN